MRRILCATLALMVILTLAVPVFAAQNATSCIQQMINYFCYYQEDAQTDLDRLNQELAQIDETLAAQWKQIMDFWCWTSRNMDCNETDLPDSLPEDNSLCIVVLGYGLKSNGAMRSELVGRLRTALAAAEKYPNAYIACTGGGTAQNKRSVTEAGQMADWLLDQGIDGSRIIIENESISTVQNAQFTCRILHEEYPQVQHLAVITSDYHLARGALLFQAESVLSGYGLDVVGTAGHQTFTHSPESAGTQASNLAQLAGISFEEGKKPKLSQLTGITTSGSTVCEAGMELDLKVYAVYDSGYTKNVTMYSNFSGFDLNKTGMQTVTVKYAEDGKSYKTSIDIEFTPRPTEAPGIAPAVIEAEIPVSTPEEAPQTSLLPMILITVLTALILILLLIKHPRK